LPLCQHRAEHGQAVLAEAERGVGGWQVLVIDKRGHRGAGRGREDLAEHRPDEKQCQQRRQGGQPDRDGRGRGRLAKFEQRHEPPEIHPVCYDPGQRGQQRGRQVAGQHQQGDRQDRARGLRHRQ
jgi:hypothetical protein